MKHMHKKADFSQIFDALLKQACLSQLEISAKTGIHKQTINRYVNGRTVPGWSELIKLAEAMDCSLDSFRTGALTARNGTIPVPDERLEQMKPIIRELGSVANKLASFISD